MKRYLSIVVSVLVIAFFVNYIYFYNGKVFIPHTGDVECVSKIENNEFIVKKENNKIDKFKIKGVDLGLGIPGHFTTERAITKETYLRWFKYIKEMGANTIRVYTIQGDDFYEAFYEYNNNHKDNPLYLIHGVWLDDRIHIINIDAYNNKFKNSIKKNALDIVDAIHGRFKAADIEESGKQIYTKDISQWVIGYILGVEWEPQAVVYTNRVREGKEQYKGKYTYTENASVFEIFLAELADEVIDYETKKYGTHRNFAISNWPTTDPFEYNDKISYMCNKNTKINVENIKTTDKFKSNQFASYHIYPYYPEFDQYDNTDENANLYKRYITRINKHHKMPVVISEFGVPTSRGMGSYEDNRSLGRDQGNMTEEEQGKAVVSLYKDIMDSGSAGGLVFIWQDEWFKKTWNTVANTDLLNTAYWSDYQTNEQSFGLLTFDPGEEKSICYTDGDKSEWKNSDKISEGNGYDIYSKYDEKYMYFMVDLKGKSPYNEKICIPIDTTQKTGSKSIKNLNIKTDRSSDFALYLDGKNNSKLFVQDRYDSLMMTFIKYNIHRKDILNNPPKKDSDNFVVEKLILHEFDYFYKNKKISNEEYYNQIDEPFYKKESQTYDTGNLLYGNGNPKAKDYNNISDFCYGKDFVEIRIPWNMLNFYNPSKMEIHDDYYEKYGIQPIKIDEMYIGVGNPNSEIKLHPMKLDGWGKNVTYHERLKKSYYILRDYWQKEGE